MKPIWGWSRLRALSFLVVLLGSSFPTTLHAKECVCDHVLEPETLAFNGSEQGVEPGASICVRGGAREFLRLSDLKGTEEAPILVTNCEGQVVIDNADRGYGLTLDGSSYVRISGTGDENHVYGFKVRASREGPDYSASCVVLGGFSSDYEVDHIEAYECGFAGVTAKTDPDCDERDLSSFVQKNTKLHHLSLHDTGGEGIYFGSTGYPSRARTCDGAEVELIPHTHEGVWIYENLIYDTGWDGLQVGVSPKDCFVYRNRIERVGLDGEEYQMQGLQIGGGSRCEIFDNFIKDGDAVGIIVLDARDTRIYNNVVTGFLDGVYINDRGSSVTESATYQVLHNTIFDIQERAVAMYGSLSQGNVVANNLIVAGGANPLALSNETDVEDRGNVVLATLEEAGFVDPSESDFRLTEGAPAVDAGVDATQWGVTVDQLGGKRSDQAPDAGAFEWGATPAVDDPALPDPALPDPSVDPRPGSGGEKGAAGGSSSGSAEGGGDRSGGPNGGSPEMSSSDEAGGCALAPSGAGLAQERRPIGWILAITGLWVFRRRRKAERRTPVQ